MMRGLLLALLVLVAGAACHAEAQESKPEHLQRVTRADGSCPATAGRITRRAWSTRWTPTVSAALAAPVPSSPPPSRPRWRPRCATRPSGPAALWPTSSRIDCVPATGFPWSLAPPDAHGASPLAPDRRAPRNRLAAPTKVASQSGARRETNMQTVSRGSPAGDAAALARHAASIRERVDIDRRLGPSSRPRQGAPQYDAAAAAIEAGATDAELVAIFDAALRGHSQARAVLQCEIRRIDEAAGRPWKNTWSLGLGRLRALAAQRRAQRSRARTFAPVRLRTVQQARTRAPHRQRNGGAARVAAVASAGEGPPPPEPDASHAALAGRETRERSRLARTEAALVRRVASRSSRRERGCPNMPPSPASYLHAGGAS